MADIAMREVTVNGVRSLVRESGQSGSPEAVVFVHGNPGSGEDWVDLVREVGTFARAVAPDMPGYGKADRPASFDYTVDGYGRHLAGLLEELGIDRAHLVLHDFGGPWGMAWASKNASRVASLTLVDIGAMPGYRWHKFARIWRTPIVGELLQLSGTRAIFRRLLDADNPRPFPRAFVDRMYDDVDWGTKRAVLKLYRATDDLGGTMQRLAGPLREAKVPTLVVWGAGDAYLPARYAQEQRKFFHVVDVCVLDRCGHWPFVDEPQRAAKPIVAFLRERWGQQAV